MRIILHTQWGETHIDSQDIIEIKPNTNIYGKSVVVYKKEQIVQEIPEQIKQMLKK